MAIDNDLPPNLPDLPADWTWRPLGEIALRERGICYGIVQPGQEVSDGVPVLRVQDLTTGIVDASSVKKVHPDVEAAYQRSRLRGGEILLSLVGTLGSVVLAPPEVAGFNVARAVGVIPVGRETARFATLALRSPVVQRYCRQWATTTVQATLNLRDVRRLPIPWPPLPEQRRIAAILGALDDKIELNRKMNRTLEEMAQALFRSRFIDFDGHDDLVDSEIGPVPRGWEVRSLDAIADFLNGAACQKYPANNGESWLPVIKIRELNQGVTTETDRATSTIPAKWHVKDGDVLFSWSGSLVVKVWTGGPGALNQHLFKVTSEEYPRWFFLSWVQHHLAEFQRIAADKATTMGHIKRHHLTDAKCAVPPADLLTKFGTLMEPVVNRQVANELESRTLITLRDALLPKLISGELRTPEADDRPGVAPPAASLYPGEEVRDP